MSEQLPAETNPPAPDPAAKAATGDSNPRVTALEGQVAKMHQALLLLLSDPCAAVAKKAKAILES